VLTSELGLAFTIALGNMPATAACSGSVAGINGNNRYASYLRLVGDKLPEFTERPFAELFSLLLPNRYPEAVKVLNRYGSLGVFGSLNNLFGYYVVCVSLKASFFARKLLQMALCRLTATVLKLLLEIRHTAPDIIDLLARIGHAIGGCGKIDDTHIYPEISCRLDSRGFRDIDHKAEVKLSPLADKISLTEKTTLLKLRVLTQNNRHSVSAIDGKNGYAVQSLERKDARIVDNGGVFCKAVQPLSVDLVRFDNFADGPYRKLGREIKRSSDLPVAGTVKTNLPKTLLLKSNLGDVIAGEVERIHSAEQRPLLVGVGK
jgi:hypothetical protein